MKSDTEIADSTVLEEIDTIARKAGIPVENLFHYGPYIAKVPLKLIDDHKAKKEPPHIGNCHYRNQSRCGKNDREHRIGHGTQPYR